MTKTSRNSFAYHPYQEIDFSRAMYIPQLKCKKNKTSVVKPASTINSKGCIVTQNQRIGDEIKLFLQ